MKNNNCCLQFITHYNERYSYEDSAKIALEGGCRWIQLRIKDAEEKFLEQMALRVQSLCREYGATFIIDDNVLLAKKIGADGVHLGKNDMPVAQARQILGEKFIIGGTVNTFEDILYHLKNGTPDYFGCGPFRFTSTKKNLAPVLGLEGYRDIVLKMREKGIDIPIVAIGGITKEDIPQLLECGVSGIALSGSIINAENPVREMADVIEILTNYKPF
ncbi:MAG: thiamine phosphate synthase [Bacteroidales bacterium]|nr:thiamine phosphate synthase [Bacteroidales bacterium]